MAMPVQVLAVAGDVPPRSASREPRCADDLAVRRLEDHSDILAFREFFADPKRRSGPVADHSNGANHIGFLQRPAAVLAAPDRGLMVAIEADQQHRTPTRAAADFDRELAGFVLGDADGGGGPAIPFGLLDR